MNQGGLGADTIKVGPRFNHILFYQGFASKVDSTRCNNIKGGCLWK
jgi:hypothetical protein